MQKTVLSPLHQKYLEAFQRCYPGVDIEIQPRGLRTQVLIDGEKGDTLTYSQLKDAISDFNK